LLCIELNAELVDVEFAVVGFVVFVDVVLAVYG
jgi:hypothetical protein